MVGESSHSFHAPGDEPAAQPFVEVPFDAHVELLRRFLERRAAIVERIEGLLNAQRRPPQDLQDAARLSRELGEYFFAGVGQERARLEHQLDEAHWASGFKPRQTPGQHNDVVDPAELASRAFLMWQRTRWPGRYGRLHYGHTLFNVYLLRRLMLLVMRIFDAGSPPERLAQVQSVLDAVWRTAPTEQPVLVRDARWLFPLAQSPTTDELHGYFVIAERVAETLPEQDRIEIHTASVRMAGGHLRSQLRHVSTQKGVALDEHELTLSTRRSNALDLATLIQGLVPLLEEYERAVACGDREKRSALADTLCQGISPDPELFLNRLDLLGPYSMIEHLFITTEPDGRTAYSPTGQRHLRLLDEYAALMARARKPLAADCPRFRPENGAYSPYGALYGFSSRLLEHMALKATQPDTATRYSLEDVFTRGEADKLAWVNGWRNLPHVPRDVVKMFEYPQQFAAGIFNRIDQALNRHVAAGETEMHVLRHGRLFIAMDDPESTAAASSAPALPRQYVLSSDQHVVAEQQAEACDGQQLLHRRLEGEFLVSYETPGGWVAVSKDVLTDVLGAQRDARIAGLPKTAARVAKAMCPTLVVLDDDAVLADSR